MVNCYYNKYFYAVIVAVLLLVAVGPVYAQNNGAPAQQTSMANGLNGLVIDEFGVAVPNAAVFHKYKTDTVHTDANGHFSIAASVNDVLSFKAPNFYVSEVRVKRADTMTVRLLNSYLKAPKRIDVLYGTANPANFLGSIASIYTNQITTTPATLYLYALPGQLAGLNVAQYSGFTSQDVRPQTSAGIGVNVATNNLNTDPSDNAQFLVRLRGQDPITIIDNVQRNISSIDPESIESISVLKDALSTILMGNKASRGVLLVTTKKAEIGKPRVSFTAQTALQQPLALPTPLPAYQYAYLVNEALQNDGRPARYTVADYDAYRNQTDPLGHPDINWFNTLLRKTSPLTTYRLNVNGGTSVARYTISLNYLDQVGMFKTASGATDNTNNDLKRYMINSNISVNVTPKLVVDLQLFGRIQQFNQPGVGYSSLLNTLYGTPNNAYPIYNKDGSFAGNTNFTTNLLSQSQYGGYLRTNNNDVLANLDLKYDLSSVTPGLSLSGKGNISYVTQGSLNRSLENSTFTQLTDTTVVLVRNGRPLSNAFTPTVNVRYSYAQGGINYDRTFDRHNFTGQLLYDYRSVVANYDLSQVTTNRAAKFGYNYNRKYFIEAALNNSGYSRYAPGKQFGMFYAFGLGWQMANESFIKDNFSWINSWKWRATYGKTGNANAENGGYYGFRQTYSSQGYVYTVGTTDGIPIEGYQQNGLANPNLTWEKANKLDIGTDIAMFNDHFSITADYFRDRYYGLLQFRGSQSFLLGTGYVPENIGIRRYEGGELSLTYQNRVNNFNYFFSANGSVLSSINVFSDEVAQPYPWMVRTGKSTETIYGYRSLGFFQSAEEIAASPIVAGTTPKPGDLKYADINGDGIISNYDEIPIANRRPQIFYGATVGFNYKGFSLSVIFQGLANRQIIFLNNYTTGLSSNNSGATGQGYEQLLARWTPETAATATLPRLSFTYGGNRDRISTSLIRSGSYMRLKNAEIGYTLPYQLMQRIHLSGLRVFVNGENLATFYGLKGFDPEVNGAAYPIQRVINAGVSIKL